MAADSSEIRVGVLSLHNSKETKAICNAISALGHEAVWYRAENTAIQIVDDHVGVDPSVDVIVNRLLLSSTNQPCEELGLADVLASAIPMLNAPCAVLSAMHKFSAASRLAEAGIPVPDAFLALDSARLNEARAEFGEEAVYKTAIGTHGGGTWKVGREDAVNAQVGMRRAFLQSLVTQADGPNRDLRVYVVNGEVIGAMNRFAPDQDWRTNVALGGSVNDGTGDLSAELREMSLNAVAVLGLEIAGVDLVQGEQGWYVLEVNPTAGFRGFFAATGIRPAPYIAATAIEHVGGSIDTNRVEELAETLDDSVPACKPLPRPSAEPVRKTVGLSEEVMVSGTNDSQSVYAKSDTGASRTSIDTSLAAAIGAGPIKDIARIKSGSQKAAKTRPVVDVVVGIGGNRHTVTASVEDRSHMEFPVLLGRDILKHYHVDVTRNVGDPAQDGQLLVEE